MADNTTNPQDMVDAALGTTDMSKSTDTTMGSTPLTAPTTPASTMETLPPPPPAPDPVDPALLTPPTTTTTTTTTVTAPSTGMVVGDDTPLAFATKPGSVDTTVTSVPGELPGAATLPPLGGMPAGTSASPAYSGMTTVTQAKPKGKAGKILVALVGFLMIAGGVFGGYQYYLKNYGTDADIAIIETTPQDQCNGCVRGGRLVWRNGRCVHTGTCEGDSTPTPSVANVGSYRSCTDAGYAWCGGCGGFCNTTSDQTCNQMQVSRCGEPVVSGASCSSTSGGRFTKGCDCSGPAGDDTWFDRNGICSSKDAAGTVDPSYYDTYGLCAVARGGCPDGNATTGPNAAMYSCNNSGCSVTDAGFAAGYRVYKYQCNRITDLSGGCQDGNPTGARSATFSATCGSEQIDVGDGSSRTPVDFRSRTYATACGTSTTTTPTPSPSPSVTPVSMACTGITRTPTTDTPAIGTTMTFTCAGTLSPATAARANITYKFRYSKNAGADVALPNKTATTAELTITSCGNYKVDCQACVTFNGVAQCDPIWSAARVQ